MAGPYDYSWQRLRKAKLARDPLCELRHQGCTLAATEVDHIVSIRRGGARLHWDNLQSVCRACHSQKSAYVDQRGKAVPTKGCDPATGRPLDQSHWWNK